MRKSLFFILCAFILLWCSSCSTPVNLASISQSGDYCQPVSYSPDSLGKKSEEVQILAVHVRHPRLSLHDLFTANAIGILPQLIALDSLHQLPQESRAPTASLKWDILEKIQRSSEEMDGLAATLDCEGEKTDQIAHYIDNLNNRRNNKITIASIIMGSLTTIATVAIDKQSVQNTVAIAGGIASSGLAVMTINPSGKKVRWLMDRNLLNTIWEDNNSKQLIPASIWYMLNQKAFSNSQKITLVESIKNRWLHINFQDEITASDLQKFFGQGGVYTAEDLHLKANMLNELQATVRSLHQDLSSLMQAISRYHSLS